MTLLYPGDVVFLIARFISTKDLLWWYLTCKTNKQQLDTIIQNKFTNYVKLCSKGNLEVFKILECFQITRENFQQRKMVFFEKDVEDENEFFPTSISTNFETLELILSDQQMTDIVVKAGNLFLKDVPQRYAGDVSIFFQSKLYSLSMNIIESSDDLLGEFSLLLPSTRPYKPFQELQKLEPSIETRNLTKLVISGVADFDEGFGKYILDLHSNIEDLTINPFCFKLDISTVEFTNLKKLTIGHTKGGEIFFNDECLARFLKKNKKLEYLEVGTELPNVYGHFLSALSNKNTPALKYLVVRGLMNIIDVNLQTQLENFITLKLSAMSFSKEIVSQLKHKLPRAKIYLKKIPRIADENSKRFWRYYSLLPLDYVLIEKNSYINLFQSSNEISVCFQPTPGNKGMLVELGDSSWIYTSFDDEFNDSDIISDIPENSVTDQSSIIESSEFSELHTHLMGMGNANFWIEVIMKQFIPSLVQTRPILQPKFESLLSSNNSFSPQDIEQLSLESEVFSCNAVPTNDVVYSLEDLSKAFNLEALPRKEQEAHTSKVIGAKPHYYYIFNQREEKFELKYGFTNKQIIDKLDADEKRKPDPSKRVLFNTLLLAFEMKLVGVHNGKFTPDFYPQRFIMKDSMYFMYPEILSLLLLHTIYNYYQEGVEYVEYSVSLKDLKTKSISRYLKPSALESIWNKERSLITNDNIELNHIDDHLEIKENGKTKNFYYYFLAAMNRNNMSLYKKEMSATEKFEFCCSQQYLKQAFSEQIFQKPLEQLCIVNDGSEIEVQIEKLFKLLEIEDIVDVGAVVGFDWVGDEKYFAPCVFVLKHFWKIAELYNKKTGQVLGLRYHCGENTFIDKDKTFFLKHMDITFWSIIEICKNMKVKLRLGHGVGFMLEQGSGPFYNEEIFTRMKKYREILMKDKKVFFEWCPTSNEFLLFDFHDLSIPVDINCLTVATDNDGIMPVQGVKNETKKAAKYFEDLKISTPAIVKITAQIFVANAKRARFIETEY